ncbi:MAG: redox-sensing transcriptional repressor Rex [Treponema sp.]|nr:redox-sensing transcriptional repressor Rex [Treponema sp.]
MIQSIPEPTKRRLVQIAQLLSQYMHEGTVKRITSKDLQSVTTWSDSLIRRDILLLGYKGGVSNGYDVQELYKAICDGLNIRHEKNALSTCCIVGLGRLGVALLENSIFEGSGFSVVAGFDSSVNRVEVLRSSFPLYPASQMETVIRQQHITFAVLTVPEKEAVVMGKRLVDCGIKGIVNYTSAVLPVSQDIIVENVSPITALTNIAAKLAD